MRTTLLWRSLGIMVGVTGSAVYVHLTPHVTVMAAAPVCVSTMGEAGATMDTHGSPPGASPQREQVRGASGSF